MRVVVTGGAGYIGAHVCKALCQNGYEPVVIDNLSLGHRAAVLWGLLEEGDIRDEAFLEAVFVRYRPVGVIHCAGLSSIADSLLDPQRYYNNNVVGSLQVLRAMQKHQVNHFIFSSSCAIFGAMKHQKIAENHPTAPLSPYGWSKLMTEQTARDFHRAYGIRYALLRYFNAAGADLEGQIGESHDPETHLIPLVFDAVLGRLPCITVFGDQHDTPDGTPVRDFVHVSDLAEAHVMCLRHLQRKAECLELNLGSGQGHSVKQVIHAVERIVDASVPVQIAQRRSGDAAILVADSSKITSKLGWAPRCSDLTTILVSSWLWHQRQCGAICSDTKISSIN